MISLCFIFGHKYAIAQKLTHDTRRLCCKRCRKSFAMSDSVKSVLAWDADFHRLYESYGIEIKYLKFENSKQLINGVTE